MKRTNAGGSFAFSELGGGTASAAEGGPTGENMSVTMNSQNSARSVERVINKHVIDCM